jgi:hypothetical protein
MKRPCTNKFTQLFILLITIISYSNYGQNLTSTIDSLGNAKKNIPLHLQKVDQQMLGVITKMKSQGINHSNVLNQQVHSHFSTRLINLDNNGNIHAEIYLKKSDDISVNKLKESGVKVEYNDTHFNIATCWVPFDTVEYIAKDNNVLGIYNCGIPIHHTGSYTTAGDQILKSDSTRLKYGISGQGIKIGVLSNGVDHWTSSRNTGDLPANFEVINNRYHLWYPGYTFDEGTAMSEIIYDIAPGTSLAFSDYGRSESEFNLSIDSLRAHGCKVIVDDVTFSSERMFEDGPAAQHIDDVASTYGIKFISSAGNEALTTWDGMGTDRNNDKLVVFNSDPNYGEHNYIGVPPGHYLTAVLQWANKWGQSCDDYDLYLTSGFNLNNPLDSSSNIQNGGGLPYESIDWLNDTGSSVAVCLSVTLTNVNVDVSKRPEMKLVVYLDNRSLDYKTDTGIFGHAAADSCISVGAIDASHPQSIDNYSSLGPSRIYSYDSNGNPVSHVDRPTPTICGIDGVQTYVGMSGNWYPGYSVLFSGTSAAAPHVAGIAALILAQSVFSNLTLKQLIQKITSTATKVTGMGGQNFINAYGYGRINALESEKNIFTNVTVPSGTTFQVNPGSTFNFKNGSSLIVNGTLTANGNSASTPILFNFTSPNSSTQNGIVFNSGSSGTINYCQIRNAYRGIYENNKTVNITNSAISGCTDGIYLYYSSPLIQGCSIYNNSNDGVNLLYSTSSTVIKEDSIYNNYDGLYCSSNSNPIVGNSSTLHGNNILNNSAGIICFNNANPKIGGNGSTGGYNNIVNTSYNVLNTTGNTIYAYDNWWGTTNPTNFKSGGALYTSYLSAFQTGIPHPPLSKTSGNLAASVNGDIPMLAELDNAYELKASNNLAQARTVCLNLINNYPDYSVSYNALNLLQETYSDNELSSKKDIYSTIFNNKVKKDLYATAGLILANIDKENKVKHIDDVINNYTGQPVVELALFDKFVYYNFEKQDRDNSLAISKELDALFPLSRAAIDAHKILGDMEYYNIKVNDEKALQKTTNITPTEYTLVGNYPNPFNPTTRINYQLPKEGLVSLKVYDILGREVASLVNETQNAGNYSVPFDASKLSSGIYIYTIHANDFIQSKKMNLVK